jgi:hypothetical protein
MNFAEAVRAIEEADGFAELTNGHAGAAFVDPADAYRKLSKIVHPDAAPAALGATATQAFAKLSALWANRATTAVAAGDIADLHAVDGGLLKVPRSHADNDLMAAEAAALRTLWTDGDPRHRAYAPRLIESVTRTDGRVVNKLERLHGFLTLAEVLRRRPGGIDPRDAAWIWRRLLVALGWAHRAGLVHGAVLPAHVLIHPTEHGVVLVDWCYAVRTGNRIPALVAEHRADYPPEIPHVTAATDIYMATVLMGRLIKDKPKPVQRFLDGCLYDAPRMRPHDAWALLAELDDMLGRRTFRPFTI